MEPLMTSSPPSLMGIVIFLCVVVLLISGLVAWYDYYDENEAIDRRKKEMEKWRETMNAVNSGKKQYLNMVNKTSRFEFDKDSEDIGGDSTMDEAEKDLFGR